MNLVENIEKLAETNAFRIIGFENGNVKFKGILPGNKLYDVDDNDIMFFDIDTGLRVNIHIDPDMELVSNKIILDNDCLIEIVDNYESDSVSYISGFKNNHNFNNRLYVEI